MTFNYFPGCTLKTQAKDLDIFARKAAHALGADLEEIEEWQCCGATYPLVKDEIAVRLSSVRALDYAKHNGGVLVTLCSACHNVIKRVNSDMASDAEINAKVNAYMALDEGYNGETKVVHYLELLRDYVGFENIKKAVKKPLGKKIGAYYGCLLLRPSGVMAFDNPENPTIIEDFIEAIGGEAVKYPFRNECCGAYVQFQNKELTQKKSDKIIENALACGAEMLVTACPLCYYNLKEKASKDIEVVYLTDLLCRALDIG